MSRSKGRQSSRRVGKRGCGKQKTGKHETRPRRKPCNKQPTYPHPLATAMSDLLGNLVAAGKRIGRSGRKVLWTPALLCICSLLMSWDPSPTLAERFEKAGLSLGHLLPRRGKGNTYQGYIKALRRNDKLHGKVAAHLREQMRQTSGSHWLREGWCAFAADGSKINCPRTKANEDAFGCASKKGKTQGIPQQFLTILWHMGTGMPWDWQTGLSTSSEREHLMSMLGRLPEEALAVADAGFVGYDLLKTIADSKRFFLIRVGSNVALLQELGLCAENDDSVYLWPQYDRRKSTRRKRNAPMPLRLIRIHQPGKQTMYLLTNVAEEQKLPHKSAQVLYEMRWGVEIFFRSLKQKLQKRKLCCAAPEQARLELHWAVLGIWVLEFLAVRQILAVGKDPLSFSVAMALRAVRRAAAARAVDCGDLPTRLANAVKDTYTRTGSKRARNWPRIKATKPPGAPKIERASESEIKLAQEFHGKAIAA